MELAHGQHALAMVRSRCDDVVGRSGFLDGDAQVHAGDTHDR